LPTERGCGPEDLQAAAPKLYVHKYHTGCVTVFVNRGEENTPRYAVRGRGAEFETDDWGAILEEVAAQGNT